MEWALCSGNSYLDIRYGCLDSISLSAGSFCETNQKAPKEAIKVSMLQVFDSFKGVKPVFHSTILGNLTVSVFYTWLFQDQALIKGE